MCMSSLHRVQRDRALWDGTLSSCKDVARSRAVVVSLSIQQINRKRELTALEAT